MTDGVRDDRVVMDTLPAQRPGRLGATAMVVVWAAVLARALALTSATDLRLAYIVGMGAFLTIQVVVLVRLPRPTPTLHVAFALQAAIALVLLSLAPERDFITVLLVLECYQAAVVFSNRTRLIWVAVLVALIGASLVLDPELGPLRGLALALVPMAAGIVLSTFVVVNRELEVARATSEGMVADLQVAQGRLRDYADQVDELAAIEQRSRLARDLQESVSSTLAGALDASAAARERLGDPVAATGAIERLQTLTQQALAQMRAIIEELRPPAVVDSGAGVASDPE